MTKAKTNARPTAAPTVPALTIENLAAAVERGVRAAIRPETTTPPPPVDQYEKAQTAVSRISPIARAIDALAGLHNIEARVHTLTANIVGMQPENDNGSPGSAPSPSGVFNVLDLAAGDAITRMDRIHQMLGTIERALP